MHLNECSKVWHRTKLPRIARAWCSSVSETKRQMESNQMWAVCVEDHPWSVLCLSHQASHRWQKWNINSAHICTLMTTCPFKHKMATSVSSSLSAEPHSGQSTWGARLILSGSDLIYLETWERGWPFSLSEGCHHRVIILYSQCNTKLISAMTLLGPTRRTSFI